MAPASTTSRQPGPSVLPKRWGRFVDAVYVTGNLLLSEGLHSAVGHRFCSSWQGNWK
jgi:hypothetical protein